MNYSIFALFRRSRLLLFLTIFEKLDGNGQANLAGADDRLLFLLFLVVLRWLLLSLSYLVLHALDIIRILILDIFNHFSLSFDLFLHQIELQPIIVKNDAV